MAKKDENGRIIVPKDLIEESWIFVTDDFKPYFFVDHLGAVGIYINVGADYPNDILYLGDCDFDKSTNSILLPDNVDCALGGSDIGEYFFYIDFSQKKSIPHRLYICKVNLENDNIYEKLSALVSNVEKLSDRIDAYISEDIEE